MRTTRNGRWTVWTALALAAALPGQAALAQSEDAAPAWVDGLKPEKKKLIAERIQTARERRVAMERDLKKLRFEYLRSGLPSAKRDEGLEKLRAFTDPVIFPTMLEIFRSDPLDLRLAILDHLASIKSPESDAALAWVAIYDPKEEIRGSARERLITNAKAADEVSDAVKIVVYTGLTKGTDEQMSAAARAGNVLNLAEAIPWLINAQAGGQLAQAGGNANANSNLAWIMVAKQIAYVSDLTPVVGPSAVAFDPQLSVVNDGTLLRVIDAVVVTYHIELNRELIDLSSRLYEQPTRGLGWNLPGWRKWYTDEFKPHWAAKQEERRLAKAEAAEKPGKK